MPRRYAILDVFSDRPLAGNALSVVLDSDGLGDAEMQAIAREFNLSETAFVLPPQNPLHSARIRIFTPARELPFAGHPTVGAAVLLGLEAPGRAGGPLEKVLVLEERVGPVRCGVSIGRKDAGHAVFDLPLRPSEAGEAPERDVIAVALGLQPVEIGFENHQPSAFSAGIAFTFVPVRGLDEIARASPNSAAWDGAFGGERVGVYVYCRETVSSGHHFHARLFAPSAGIAEDPATGAAVAALAGVIRRFDTPPAGSHRYVIEQGFEMGRPSLIGLEIDLDDGQIQSARVGGDAVVVARGHLGL